MIVSMMKAACSGPDPLSIINVYGANLDGALAKLKIKDDTAGVDCTYTVTSASDYFCQFTNLNPAVVNNHIYTISYDGRPLFSTVISCPRLLSGLYYLDPLTGAKRDNYYTILKKIPDPTIRTAFIGE